MYKYESKYKLGDIVYLVTDEYQKAWQILQVIFTPTGRMYYMSCGINTYQAYEIEITNEKAPISYRGFFVFH